MPEDIPGFDVTEEPDFAKEFDPTAKFLGSETAAPSGSTKRPPGAPRATPMEKKLEKLYGGIGMTIYAFDPHCGGAIIENAGPMAASLDQLAKQNPEVKRILEKLMETSAYTLVLAAHLPVAFAIASHHIPKVRELVEQVNERMQDVPVPDGVPTDWAQN